MHPQDTITNQTLDDVSQKNLNNILAHKEAKPHSHPHNIMMGKQIKKEIKRDESGMKINIKGTKSLASEAKKRDHRKLGKELGLFTFHHWAPGAPFWHAKGTTLYQTLADYMRRELSGEGYQEVRTPLVFNKQLWETSGHWEHYRENMSREIGRRTFEFPK